MAFDGVAVAYCIQESAGVYCSRMAGAGGPPLILYLCPEDGRTPSGRTYYYVELALDMYGVDRGTGSVCKGVCGLVACPRLKGLTRNLLLVMLMAVTVWNLRGRISGGICDWHYQASREDAGQEGE
jgi:hypothetical protein